MTTIIDVLIERHEEISESLERHNEISLLEEGCRSFLSLGRTRNQLVHENFANANVDNTLQEIVDLYRKALDFVEYLAERIQP